MSPKATSMLCKHGTTSGSSDQSSGWLCFVLTQTNQAPVAFIARKALFKGDGHASDQ